MQDALRPETGQAPAVLGHSGDHTLPDTVEPRQDHLHRSVTGSRVFGEDVVPHAREVGDLEVVLVVECGGFFELGIQADGVLVGAKDEDQAMVFDKAGLCTLDGQQEFVGEDGRQAGEDRDALFVVGAAVAGGQF